ncbi:MAG: PD-(D/E)XK nuclease family protein, partial [Anaerolineae bacterium]
PYWDAVLSCVAGLAERVEEPPIDALPAPSECMAPGQLLTGLALAGAAAFPITLQEPYRGLVAARRVLAQRKGWAPPGPYEGILSSPAIISQLEAYLGDGHLWSASRLNRYGLCPYSFFANHILGLEAMPDPEAGLDAMVRGSLLHRLLETLFRRASAEGLAPTVADEPALIRRLEEVAEAALADAPERYGFLSGPLWQHEKAELVRLVAALVRHECEENGTQCQFYPLRQELRFGLPGGDLPPLEVRDEDGNCLRMQGVIDRLDCNADGDLRLVDYKSGSTPISANDVKTGRALQTALYALAAEQLLGQRVVESYYLHLPTRERSGRLTLPSGASQDEMVQRAAEAALSFAAGARAGRFPISPNTQGCRLCDAADLCRADRHARAKARQVAPA